MSKLLKNPKDKSLNPGENVWQNNVSNSLKSAEASAIDNQTTDNQNRITNDSTESGSTILDREKNSSLYKVSLKSTSSKKTRIGKLKTAKSGPIGIIILLMIFGGGGGAAVFFGGPSFLFPSLMSNVVNQKDTSAFGINSRFKRYMTNILNGKDKAEGVCSDKKKSKRCVRITMSNKMIKTLEKQGIIKVERGKEFNGRNVVKSFTLTLRNGKTRVIRTSSQLRAAFKSPNLHAIFNRSYKPMSASFSGGRFVKRLSTLGLSKGPGISGKDKKELNNSFRKSMGLKGEASNGDPKKKKENVKKQYDKFSKKMKAATKKKGSALTKACRVYGGAKGSVTYGKLIQLRSYIPFFINLAIDLEKAKVDQIEPEVATYYGDKLTYNEKNKFDPEQVTDDNPEGKNRFYRSSFSDAPGMKDILNGEGGSLDKFGNAFVLGGGKLSKISKATKIAEVAFGAAMSGGSALSALSYLVNPSLSLSERGRVSLKSACRALVEAGGAKALKQLAKNPVGAIIMIALEVAGGIVLQKVAMAALEKYSDEILELMTLAATDETTRGIDAGHAIAAGAGLAMQLKSTSTGHVAGTSKDHTNYLAYTSEDYLDYIAAERFIARDEPLNISNQYSFLGSIVMNLYKNNVISFNNNPFYNFVRSFGMLGVAAHSISTFSTVGAAQGVHMPIRPFSDSDLGCTDPYASNETFTADKYCVQYTHIKGADKWGDSALSDVIDRMIDKHKAIKESGEIRKLGAGKLYRKFNKFCLTRNLPAGMVDRSGNEDGTLQKFPDSEADGVDIESLDGDDDEDNDTVMGGIIEAAKNTPLNTLELIPGTGTAAKAIIDKLSGENTQDEKVKEAIEEAIKDFTAIDAQWETGVACTNPSGVSAEGVKLTNEMLADFMAYSMDEHEILPTMDEKVSSGAGEGDGEATGDFGLPIDSESALMSSCYGWRPGVSATDMHYAIDLATGSTSTKIIAADGGEVTQVGNDSPPFSGYGNTVVVKHKDDLYTRYSHMSSITVEVGDKVTKGQELGFEGGTGGGGYPVHLDFGVSSNPNVPNTTDTMNPLKFVEIPESISNPHGCSADYNGEAAGKDDPMNDF